MYDTRLIVQRLNSEARLPTKSHPSDAAYDLYVPEAQTLAPGERRAIGVGLAIELESGWEAQIRGRSGLAARGIAVHFGTIDHLYRQELKVLVHNTGEQPWSCAPGDRIAQMKLARVYEVELVEGPVTGSERGGLGSTGR